MPEDFVSRLQSAIGAGYVVDRELTAGGQSRLFLASDAHLPRRVVIKVLPPELAGEIALKRFRREISVMVKLQHPHIVPIIAMGTAGDLLWYVMPFIDGESLEDRLKRGPLSLSDGLRALHEVADALAHAHAIGVVHRDLKPANVLFQSGHAMLADFGVAHARGEVLRTSAGISLGEARKSLQGGANRLTERGFAVGTPGYMAPEQFVGDEPADARADVYALAMVGYEILTGKAPFSEYKGARMMVAHFTELPPPAHTVRPEVPESVALVLEKGMAKEAGDRYESAAGLRDALPSRW